VILLVVALVARLVRIANAEGPMRAAARVALFATVGFSVLIDSGLVVRALGDETAGPLRASLVDVALMGAAAAVAVRAPAPKWARPALSLGLWGATIVASAIVLALVPGAPAALGQAAPMLLPLVGWLGG
jgi:hypothetical protein